MDDTRSAVVTAGGAAIVDIQPRFGQTWDVSQLSNEMRSAPGSATCDLRKNGAFVTDLIPQSDVAGDPPPTRLTASDHLTVNWAGCTPGDIGKVYFVYELVTE